MAGASADFDAAGFRSSIRSVMLMAQSNTRSERPTFYFEPGRAWARASASGKPFDWTAAPLVNTTKDPVQALCAVEVQSSPSVEGTDVGAFKNNRAVLTFLDVDYEEVRDFSEVALSLNRYLWVMELPVVALFTVDVHQVLVQARSES